MAFTNFYMDGATGNDLNAGTTATGAADYTSTAGNWDGTSVFTATDGSNPSAHISVGDYICLYLTGDAAGRLIAQVTGVAAGVNGAVTVSTTQKFGVTPATQTGTANIKHGGAWASFAPCAANGFLSTGTLPAGFSLKINLKLGTYANTTTARTLTLAGITTAPIWVDGYKSAPGDLDSLVPSAARVPGTDIPLVSFTTVGFTAGAYQTYSNLAFTSAKSGSTFTGAAFTNLDRVQVSNTSSNAAASALTPSSSNLYNACAFTVTTTTGPCLNFGSQTPEMFDCVVNGGNNGISATSGSGLILRGNLFINQTTACITFSTGGGDIGDNDFYGGGGATDGIKWTGTPAASTVRNNYFESLTNGVNNASGTNTANIRTRNNDKFSVTNLYVGLSDLYQPCDQTESASAVTNAAGGDFTVLSTSNAAGNGSPGLYEGLAKGSTPDIGAWQRAVTAGAAGLLYQPDMTGGMGG